MIIYSAHVSPQHLCVKQLEKFKYFFADGHHNITFGKKECVIDDDDDGIFQCFFAFVIVRRCNHLPLD